MIEDSTPEQIIVYKYSGGPYGSDDPDMLITKCGPNLLFDIEIDSDHFVQLNCNFKEFVRLLQKLN